MIKTGLVFEGGGAKGAFSYGVLKELCSNEKFLKNFQIVGVAGTSVGALNGALLAFGSFNIGDHLWRNISFDGVYPLRRPKWLYLALAVLAVMSSAWAHNKIYRRQHNTLRMMSLSVSAIQGIPLIVLASLSPVPYAYYSLFVLYVFVSEFGERWRNLNCIELALGLFFCCILSGADITSSAGAQSESDFMAANIYTWLSVVLINIVCYILSTLTILERDPLRRKVEALLENKCARFPLYVTYATTAQVFDPQNPSYSSNRYVFQHSGYIDWCIQKRPKWIPNWARVDNLTYEEACRSLLASAALPYSLVPEVALNGQITAVDGGVVDNIPVWPIIEYTDAEFILVLRVAPKGGWDVEKHWAESDRLVQLNSRQSEFPEGKLWVRNLVYGDVCDIIESPPDIVISPRNRDKIPLTEQIAPTSSLGNFVTGTMNFRPAYARALLSKGKIAANEWLGNSMDAVIDSFQSYDMRTSDLMDNNVQ